MAVTHKTKTVTGTDWVPLNDGGAITGEVSLYALDHPVWVKATTTAAAPTSTDGAIVLWPQSAIINMTMVQLFPGLATGAHLYAMKREATASVTISHD